MSHQFQAIYEGGLLRPLEPLTLHECEVVTVTLEAAARADPSKPQGDESKAVIQRQQQAWNAYVKRMEAMPDNSPPDGFSNRDHDDLLYGEKI